MKKLFFSLIACWACFNSVEAALSPLHESVREYEAILSSDLLKESIPHGEFVVDLRRRTKRTDISGVIHYLLVTRVPGRHGSNHETGILDNLKDLTHKDKKKKHHNKSFNRYDVKMLLVKPSDRVGPPMITIEHIKPIEDSSSISDVFN